MNRLGWGHTTFSPYTLTTDVQCTFQSDQNTVVVVLVDRSVIRFAIVFFFLLIIAIHISALALMHSMNFHLFKEKQASSVNSTVSTKYDFNSARTAHTNTHTNSRHDFRCSITFNLCCFYYYYYDIVFTKRKLISLNSHVRDNIVDFVSMFAMRECWTMMIAHTKPKN